MKNPNEKELESMIREKDQQDFPEKCRRLRLLISSDTDEPIPIPILALQYFEEVRLCYYCGAFIATIFMAHTAFEELLRSHYRTIRGAKAHLSCGKSVGVSSFSELIDEARKDGYITQNEADDMTGLRRLKNAFQHTKDTLRTRRRSWFSLAVRIARRAEKDARWAMKTLSGDFGAICKRWGGL